MEIENIHIHSECMPALVELTKSCGYKGVIHKGEQWIKFYKGREYIGAMKVVTNASDEEFIKNVDMPF